MKPMATAGDTRQGHQEQQGRNRGMARQLGTFPQLPQPMLFGFLLQAVLLAQDPRRHYR
jgi:hypothetical protein